MADNKVPNSALAEAGLLLMSEAGRSLTKAETKGRAMIYRTAQGETVRIRTCNDHVLVVLADRPTLDAGLNIEGTDFILIVMPTTPRARGGVIAYLVPTAVAVQAARSTHAEWLASRPNTKGENRTWNLWFDETGPSEASSFGSKWAEYRLGGKANVGEKASRIEQPAPPVPTSLGQVIADSRRMIAAAAGVPISAVKITIDLA